MDEKCELRDLVAKTLENNGTLAKLRAQLRASVFLALEEQDFCKAPVNKPLQDFVSTTEGALITCLVREFLECFGLDVSLSVFDPETDLGKDYELTGRKSLIQHLGLNITNDADAQKPLLAHLLKLDKSTCKSVEGVHKDEELFTTFQKKVSITDNKISEHTAKTSEQEKSCKANSIVTKVPEHETVPRWTHGDGLAASEGTFSAATKQLTKTKKVDENVQPFLSAIGGSAVSLSNLPPLLGSDAKRSQQSHMSAVNSDSDLEQLKDIIDMGLDYEEDFNSSGSGHGKSLAATDTDIEEEIEDVDEVSNISAGEDLTADKSLSLLK